MHQYSKNADVVFIGLRIPEPDTEKEYARRLMRLSEGLNTTIFVHNGDPEFRCCLA